MMFLRDSKITISRTAWNAIEWSPEMIAFIKGNFKTKTNKKLAQELGLKVTAVREKCYELGLYKLRMEYWNEEQIQFLKDNYKKIGDTEIAEIFNKKYKKNKGWTKKHIEKKRRYLNLKRSMAEIKSIREDWRIKGLYAESVRKMWKTRGCRQYGDRVVWKGESFTKIEIGYINTRVFVWNENFGEVPDGMLIRHKDGNQLNCEIDNLELVTRADNCRMNVYNSFSKYPEELRMIIKLKRALNRQINKIEKNE
ncbi:HNH endonuclease signature motif containing protein [Chryseobacterium sp. Hurlbut01]|uniref:HNH endonuclease signature motif containing protein n=1 Tax=Chryseobacterium sp. Hurlbut01 TaxID=1681828 RepID=UPI000AA97A7A|nr:HNH endonuclease signature motif containing protein [Chryseobacterium sp. Hurlbut01]